MDRRKIILVGVFGGAILVLFVRGVVFPEWIAPLLTIDDRIVKREEDLATLQAEESAWRSALRVPRLGGPNASFDPNRVVLDVRELLTRLIEKHKLQDSKVNPTRISEDRKTKLSSTTVTVSGIGTLESAIGFLRDLSEGAPTTRLRERGAFPGVDRGQDRRRGAGDVARSGGALGGAAASHGRQAGVREASPARGDVAPCGARLLPIWTGEPFSDFVPLQAQATPSFNVETGGTVILDVSASGGTPPYAYEWSPAEGLSKPDATHPPRGHVNRGQQAVYGDGHGCPRAEGDGGRGRQRTRASQTGGTGGRPEQAYSSAGQPTQRLARRSQHAGDDGLVDRLGRIAGR